jgi:2-oxoglutarate ferredoxin oxidoreductase subunit delta
MAGIRINDELCKSCKLCVGACPRELIEMEPELLNSKGFHPASPKKDSTDKCTGCTFCAIICPHLAIEVDR